MGILLTALAWLKGLSFIAKVASVVGPIATFVPGGQIVGGIVSVVGAVAKAIGQVIRWAWSGVVVCFTHPTAFVVCVVFMCFGAWSYSYYHADIVADLRSDLAKATKQRDAATGQLKGWQSRHAEQEKRANEAEAARALAEAARKKADDDRAAVQPGAVGVRSGAAPRPRAASRPAQPAEFGMLKGLFSYPSGPGR